MTAQARSLSSTKVVNIEDLRRWPLLLERVQQYGMQSGQQMGDGRLLGEGYVGAGHRHRHPGGDHGPAKHGQGGTGGADQHGHPRPGQAVLEVRAPQRLLHNDAGRQRPAPPSPDRADLRSRPSVPPRLGDDLAPEAAVLVGAVMASTAGKIELETLGDETREEAVHLDEDQGRDGENAWVTFRSTAPVVKAELNYTTDGGTATGRISVYVFELPLHRLTFSFYPTIFA